MQGAGLYNYMPLGKITLEKIRAIVKEELDAVNEKCKRHTR
jgi:prolyl-tRNA synthetase